MEDNKNWSQNQEDAAENGAAEGTQGGSAGGQTGTVAFHYQDAMETPKRDDTLPANEIRRLQFVHSDSHKDKVTKQKQARADRAARKEGNPAVRASAQMGYGVGGGGGGISRFKKHPVSDKFRGLADPQVNAVPNLNDAQTNADLKQKLENQLQNKYRNTPKFNPRPRPA